MKILRSLLLALPLMALLWFQFGQDRSLRELLQIARDQSDPRPVRRILLLGNSRIATNDMPAMLRHIADAAHAPQAWQTLSITPDGAALEDLDHDRHVARQIARPWDDIIVQPESRGQSSDANLASFNLYGADLLGKLHPAHGAARLIVNWAYDVGAYANAAARATHYAQIQDAHAALALRTGAHLVNVGKLWEAAPIALPGVALTSDGNHPTVVASYLFALCLYADMTGQKVGAIAWAPDGLAPDVAQHLRDLVDQDRADLA